MTGCGLRVAGCGSLKGLVIMLLFVNVFWGCAAPMKEFKEVKIPEALPLAPAETPREGSLWTNHSPMMLFTDLKARDVGDVLTVNIVESPKGSSKASTDTGRSSSMDAGIEALLGYEKALQEKNARFNPKTMFKGSLGHDFKGSGQTEREAGIMASLSAVVTQVLPNGNLVIRGSRETKINNETEIMVLSGIIRPIDIASDNTILSTFIADARISYYGKGIIADKQRPGWLARVLDYAWPF